MNIIKTNVDPYDSDYDLGTGRINTHKALKAANRNPEIPTINGSSSGKVGEEKDYKFYSIDPDGDDISYCVDWGDESGELYIGPFLSGIEQTVSHIWNEEGTYTISVKAKDIHGAESEWATLSVSIPKIKISNPLLQQITKIFERFPFMERILNQILSLN